MSTLPSVMVVDDEEELAHLFMELLKGSGFDTVSFTDPLLALKHFQENSQKYSLVITDFKTSFLTVPTIIDSVLLIALSSKISLVGILIIPK